MTSVDEAGPSEYDVPPPSKIKLKETKRDKASRLYRREQRRHQRDQKRISRANGYAVSPPRPYRSESISPPRRRPASPRPTNGLDEEDGVDGYRWMGGYGHSSIEERQQREEQERMDWLIQEEMSRADPFGVGGVGFGYVQPTPDTNIPLRYQHRRGHHHGERTTDKGKGKRDPSKEVEFDGGPIPDIGSMTEEEYSTWIREGMYRRKHREEVEERERQKKRKAEKEREREIEGERAEKEEKRRIRRLEKQKGREEEDKKKDQRDRYKARWKSIGETGGDIEEANLAFHDIPWPVYRGSSGKRLDLELIDKETVRAFLSGIAQDGGEEEDLKKVLRDAIRSFHPDRFFGRILPRVREADRELVKEGVEKCSRVINALAAENRG